MFTVDEVIAAARKLLGPGIPMCLDKIEEARRMPSLDEAAQLIELDSAYWNGTL